MDWQQESAKRLEEAAKLRQSLVQLGTKLLELHTRDRAKQRELEDHRARCEKRTNELWSGWVRTKAAQEPDPATGKSNEQWRRQLWRQVKHGHPDLLALDEAHSRSLEEHSESQDEVARCRDQMAVAMANMEMLSAELGCLAALVSQGGKPGA